MTRDELERVLAAEIGNIAPEIDFTDADRGEDLREAFEIDSMDFLNLVTALHQRLGIAIPEADYPKLASIDAALDYLAERV